MKQELTLDDARLAAKLAGTLNRAAEQPDPAWDNRLEQVLAQAALPARRSHKWQWSGGLALAASVAFMVALPSGSLLQLGSDTVSARAESTIDGQMLEEIDWLLAMEDAARERR